jgi:hypothetical protein
MMNVIDTCPEMPFGSDQALKAIEPDLATALVVGTVPYERSTTM